MSCVRPVICFVRQETDEIMVYGDPSYEELGWRREHAHRVWNAAMAVLMALAIEKAAYDVGRYDGPLWENRLR